MPIPPGAPLPTEHLSAKDATALTKIQAEWGKIDALQDEKVALAERMERIVNRAKERGKAEWLRVGGMDLDLLENEAAMGKPGGLGEMGNGDIMLPPGGLGSGSDMRPQKKRKLQTLPLPLPTSALPAGLVVHPPTSMGPPSAPLRPQLSARHSTAHRSGRHERHTSGLSDLDMDAHGETEETEPADGEADDTLYCFCRQKSYGEMIGCDNDKCEFEWVSSSFSGLRVSPIIGAVTDAQFHVKCVNLSAPLPETWYCPDCVSKLGLASSDGTRLSQKDKKNRRR